VCLVTDSPNFITAHFTVYDCTIELGMIEIKQYYFSIEGIFLSLKTTTRRGLIFFIGDAKSDFSVLEMIKGKIQFIFKFGGNKQV